MDKYELTKEQQDAIEEKTKTFVDNCVCKFCNKIAELGSNTDFIKDNTVRGKVIPHQIMYKVRNDNGATFLKGYDGRQYEFLVETDTEDFAYGIYFGCKCILNTERDVVEQVEECSREWEYVKGEVYNALNNTFVELDFNERELPTDNVSRMTYWPFWFRLGENEDVNQVAALATKIIRNVYRNFFYKENYDKFLNGIAKTTRSKRGRKRTSPNVNTRYTQALYDKTIQLLNDPNKYIADAAVYFEKFISLLEENQVLSPYLIYEKCWQLHWPTRHFATLYSLFYKRIVVDIEKRNEKDVIEWKLITPFVISQDKSAIDGINKDYALVNLDKTSISLEYSKIPDKIYRIINRIMGDFSSNN